MFDQIRLKYKAVSYSLCKLSKRLSMKRKYFSIQIELSRITDNTDI